MCSLPTSNNDPRSRFELAAAELRALGITLRRLPGEYCVNFRYGGDATARIADDLDQALEFGRAMAEARAAARARAKRPWLRRWRARRMTSKMQRHRFIRRRNRRGPRRALRRQRSKT
jgi:hypothetical protein